MEQGPSKGPAKKKRAPLWSKAQARGQQNSARTCETKFPERFPVCSYWGEEWTLHIPPAAAVAIASANEASLSSMCQAVAKSSSGNPHHFWHMQPPRFCQQCQALSKQHCVAHRWDNRCCTPCTFLCTGCAGPNCHLNCDYVRIITTPVMITTVRVSHSPSPSCGPALTPYVGYLIAWAVCIFHSAIQAHPNSGLRRNAVNQSQWLPVDSSETMCFK